MTRKIEDFPENVNPADSDWIIGSSFNTPNSFQKTKVLDLLKNRFNTESGWTLRDGSITPYNAVAGDKLIVNTSNQGFNINLPNDANFGDEITIFNLESSKEITVNKSGGNIELLEQNTLKNYLYINGNWKIKTSSDGSSGGSASSNWVTLTEVDNYQVDTSIKIIFNASNNKILFLPSNPTLGTEVKVWHTNSTPSIKINGKALNGLPLDAVDFIKPKNKDIITLVYVDDIFGWYVKSNDVNIAYKPWFRSPNKNVLIYSVTPLANYTYHSTTNNMQAINNNDTVTNGVIVTGNAGTISGHRFFDFRATFSTPIYLNEIISYSGQFNGVFNMPTKLEVYTNDYLKLWETNLSTASRNAQIFDLSNNDNFNGTFSSLIFRYMRLGTDNNIAVIELDLFGDTAS